MAGSELPPGWAKRTNPTATNGLPAGWSVRNDGARPHQGKDTSPPPRKSGTGNILADSASAVGGALWRGIAPIADLAAAGGDAVTDGISTVIAGTGDAVLRAGGFPNAAQSFTNFVAPPRRPARLRLNDVPDQLGTPRPQAYGLETTANILGGMALPGPKMPAPVPRLNLTPAAAPARQAATAAARSVIDDGARFGVPVFTTDVMPPKTAIGKLSRTIGERIPFAGMGGKRVAQNEARKRAVVDLVTEFGGREASDLFDNAPRAIDDIADDLMKTRGNRLSQLTTQKKTIIEGTPGVVQVPNTLAAIDAQITRLNGIGTEASRSVVAKLQDWRQAIQGKGLPAIEAIRKEMGSAFKGADMAAIRDTGDEALSAIYNPIRQDMGDFIEAASGAGARSQWTQANDELAAMAGELSDRTLKRVLQTSEMTPENVGKLLFSKNRSDVQRLWGNLSPYGQARARAAMVQKAFDGAMRSETGLSADAFATNLGKLSEQMGVAFDGVDAVRVEGLRRLLDTTKQASSAGVMPKTGAENTPILASYALGTFLGKAAIPVAAMGGLAARAYESAPVRNALLRLGTVKPGSQAYRVALRDAQRLIAPIAITFGKELREAANTNVSATARLAADPAANENQEVNSVPPLPAGYQLVDRP